MSAEDTAPRAARVPIRTYDKTLPRGDGRLVLPYRCSSLCKHKNFENIGGCPTCNEYYTSIGQHTPHVKEDKHRHIIISGQPDDAMLAKHYAEVFANNPGWAKDTAGNPVVPPSFDSVATHRARKRKAVGPPATKAALLEATYDAHDKAVVKLHPKHHPGLPAVKDHYIIGAGDVPRYEELYFDENRRVKADGWDYLFVPSFAGTSLHKWTRIMHRDAT